MAKLGVNIDHVATIRQARGGTEPDPVAAADVAELAGADGITVHLREDRRHIQDRDVTILRGTVQTHLNLEMAATDEMVAIAIKVVPDYVTLVPEKRQELTTEGGLDVARYLQPLTRQIELLHRAGITVSLFVDPDPVPFGLRVNAGHGLNYQNIRPLLALGGVEEYNIGHSIISRAVLVGLDRAVREMADLVHGG